MHALLGKRYGHMLDKYSLAHWRNANTFKNIHIYKIWSSLLTFVCTRQECKKTVTSNHKMKLKYKIDRQTAPSQHYAYHVTLISVCLSLCAWQSVVFLFFFCCGFHFVSLVVVLFSLRADCFLPLVQRDLLTHLLTLSFQSQTMMVTLI